METGQVGDQGVHWDPEVELDSSLTQEQVDE
jgi:hypothetical protein